MRKILAALAASALLAASCQRDESVIGLSLQDNQFEVRYDTLTRTATGAKRADSLSLSFAAHGLLGDYQDPHFGRTRAALAFCVLPKTTVANLGQEPAADSLTLELSTLAEYYGLDSAARHRVRVWAVAPGRDLADLDSAAVTFADLEAYKGDLLADQTLELITRDSSAARLRLDIDPSLPQRLLDSAALFASDTLFRRFFPGLVVEAESQSPDGSIATVDFVNRTALKLHFHNTGGQSSFDFVASNNNRAYRYSIFDHQYAGTPAMDAMSDTTQQQFGYLQGMSGMAMRVRLEGLADLADGGPWAVNRANLVLKVAPESQSDSYAPPGSVIVKKLDNPDDPSSESFLRDYSLDGLTTTSVGYNPEIDGYQISLKETLFDHLVQRGAPGDLTLVIYPVSTLTKANRAVMAGPAHPADSLRPVLHIIRSR